MKHPRSSSLLIISGPSGSGKSTLVSRLLAAHSSQFGLSVSHTTRSKRAGEVSGKDYHFITTSHFQNLLHHENNSPSSSKSPTLPYFIEHAQFAGNWYGTSAEAVKNVLKNRHCVLDIERQGVERLKMLIMDKSSSKSLFRKGWNSQILTQIGGQSQQTTSNAPAPLFIFIAPPSLHSLKDRLLKRGSESPESLKQRLDASANDLHWGLTSRGTFDRVIVNDELESAYSQLISTLSEFNFI